MQNTINITEASKALFIAYANDAGNWSGTPYLGQNVPFTKADRGNLTQLKKSGLVVTEKDEFGEYMMFTEKGLEYARSFGINTESWSYWKRDFKSLRKAKMHAECM